uniref:Uncharacterized protein n=1 Tax=Anguilla anguilla TaxID=7936 RepID=A0A0E9SRT0_ANGAN
MPFFIAFGFHPFILLDIHWSNVG